MHSSPKQQLRQLLSLIVLLSTFTLTFAASPYEEGWDHFSAGNYAIAKKIWLPLAKQGDADAALGLAIIYENGLQTKRDLDQSTHWYQIAADQGIPEAQHDLGIKYFTGSGVAKNYDRAFELWQAAAETGLSSAQTKLAYLYLQGLGTEKNGAEALRWYRQAAKQGNPEGMYNLSLMYKRGIGTEANAHQFQYWLLQAAEQDYAPAQYDLGLMKLHGKHMDQSVAEGRDWLVKASNSGDVNAQYYLGTLLLNGHILRRDQKSAAALLRAAAKQGHQGAKQSLVDLQNLQALESVSRSTEDNQTQTESEPISSEIAINRSEILDSVVLNESLMDSRRPQTRAVKNPRSKPVPDKPAGPWILQQDPNAYTIQLLASTDEANINKFLKDIPATVKTHRYQYVVKGTSWTGIATGSYASKQEAQLAIKTLPTSLKKNKPWIRKIGSIQKLASR